MPCQHSVAMPPRAQATDAHVCRSCCCTAPTSLKGVQRWGLQVPVVAGIANAALVTFQGCGHLALFQAVDAFVSLVDAFTSAQGVFVPHTDSYYICEGTS